MLVVQRRRTDISKEQSLLFGLLSLLLKLEEKITLFNKAHHDTNLQIIRDYLSLNLMRLITGPVC